MKMQPVTSSHILAVGFEDGTMHVQFKNGTYRYDNVPEQFHKDLMASESKGSFLSRSGLKGVKL